MIRSMDSNSLGNLDEANVIEWKRSMQEVIDRYPAARKVIPGHFSWGDGGLLHHTLDLINEKLESNS
jgi:metallo-beta-lactamase class B